MRRRHGCAIIDWKLTARGVIRLDPVIIFCPGERTEIDPTDRPGVFCRIAAKNAKIFNSVCNPKSLSGDHSSGMSKRKRSHDDDASDGTLRGLQHQLEATLSNGRTLLFRSLKLARGFERQKLGRRQKNAKSGGSVEQLEKLGAEVIALKVRTPSHMVPHI